MPASASGPQSSIAVPVMLIAFAVVISISVVRQQRVIGRLNKTDTIACSFLQADAETRLHQATNATNSAAAQRHLVSRLDRTLTLFPKSLTEAQRTFRDYLQQERTVWRVTVANANKNIVLTRALAMKSNLLSTQLACTTR